jgi:hypothetical protein
MKGDSKLLKAFDDLFIKDVMFRIGAVIVICAGTIVSITGLFADWEVVFKLNSVTDQFIVHLWKAQLLIGFLSLFISLRCAEIDSEKKRYFERMTAVAIINAAVLFLISSNLE